MSTKPVASKEVVRFNKAKGEYITAINNLNTSYGRVSTMMSGVYGSGSATSGLTDMQEHLDWLAAETRKAKKLRSLLAYMYNQGFDHLADKFQQELWAFYAEEEKQKKAEVA
jgi:hypothetical protein